MAAGCPIPIAPVTQPRTLTSPRLTNGDFFGHAVAISGDGGTLVIGVDGSDTTGVAYVYTKGADAFPTTPTTLTDPGTTGDGNFGYMVAMSGDSNTLAVSAPTTSSNRGTVYVYTRSGNDFPAAPTITLTDPAAMSGDFFGKAVTISGDGNTLVVSAPTTSGTRGPVYVYMKSGEHFPIAPTITLTAPGDADGEGFGYPVAISDDGSTLVVGAYSLRSSKGAVYVYAKSGDHFPTTPITLATPTNMLDYFGSAVTISGNGNTVVVGANGTTDTAGAAYVYRRIAGAFSVTHTITLLDPNSMSGDFFGSAVTISENGNTLVVSAPQSGGDTGTTYVYTGSEGEFVTTPTATLVAPGAMRGDYFGQTVAISGDGNTLAVGAIHASCCIGGAVHVYLTGTPNPDPPQ